MASTICSFLNGQIPLDYMTVNIIMTLVGITEGMRLQSWIVWKTGKQQYPVLLMALFNLIILGSSLWINLIITAEKQAKGTPLLEFKPYCAEPN